MPPFIPHVPILRLAHMLLISWLGAFNHLLFFVLISMH
jgi:hypothetical protein